MSIIYLPSIYKSISNNKKSYSMFNVKAQKLNNPYIIFWSSFYSLMCVCMYVCVFTCTHIHTLLCSGKCLPINHTRTIKKALMYRICQFLECNCFHHSQVQVIHGKWLNVKLRKRCIKLACLSWYRLASACL